MSRNNLIQFRKGTLAQFNSINPILASGEPGYAIDAAMLKVGNGITPWSGLPGFGTGSGISSLNNLTGPALLLVGGNNIGVTNSGTDIISISYTGVEHISISGIHNVNNSNNTFIQDLLFDQYGHVTGIASVAVTGIDSTPSNVDTIPTYTLGASSTNHYLFTGPGLTDDSPDPDIYVVRGKTHKFVNNMGAHPFQFQTTPGLGESAYTGGITGSPVSNGTLTWEVRHDTPQTLYYQCTSHANMQGTVHILGTGGAGGLTLGQLVGVSGYLQNQISSNNTFVSGIVYNTGSRDLVLTRNDGVLLTGNLSSVLHSGDSVSFLINDVPYAISGSHIDISAATSINESGRTYIQDILLDQYGHITGIATATETDVSHSKGLVNITNDTTTSVSISGGYRIGSLDIFLNGVKLILDNDFTAADGSGIVLSDSPDSGSIIEFLSLPASQISSSHPTISAASNVNNSGQTFIKDIAFDQFGHVISVTSALASGGVSSDTNTFTNTLVYNTINREIVLSKNDGASLTGNLSVVLQSGDSIGLLNNDVGYITSFAETISSGDPVSFLVNDVPYAVSGSHISVSGAQHNYFYETNANNLFVNDLMFDSYGHVTGVILGTASGLGTSSSDIYLTGVVFDASRNLNFSWNGDVNSFSVNIPASGSSTHPTIDAISNVDNSNNVFIQDLLFDTYGHVTGVFSVAVTGTSSTDSAQLVAVSGHLQSQINNIPTRYNIRANGSTNTFTTEATYSVGRIDIFQNGVKLYDGEDFSAINGTSFTLNNAIPSGSLIEYIINLTQGFNPASVSGLKMWVDADDSNTITNTAFGISQWDDKSSNGQHLTQSNTSHRPQLSNNALNGRNVINFNGTDERMICDSIATGVFNGDQIPYSTVVVWRSTGSSTKDTIYAAANNSTTARVHYRVSTGGTPTYDAFRLDDSGDIKRLTDHYTHNTFIVASITFRGSIFRHYTNGTQDDFTTGSEDDTTVNNFTVGAAKPAGTFSEFLEGDIAELLIYDHELSDINRTNIQDYLSSKWGIS